MSTAVFVKRYVDPARGDAARAHWRWLAELGSGVRLPNLRHGAGTQLDFEHLAGRAPQPFDLAGLAAALGRLHGTAHARPLYAADLDRPFATSSGLTIPGFHTGRGEALAQIGVDTGGLPAAVYKDANVRNFVITTDGPALVDFDDLTLAPFGYDLAKLVVSTAMTFGRLPAEDIEAALDAYNRDVEATGGPTGSCVPEQFSAYAEVHHLLTRRYLHRKGYRYSWADVRP